MRAGRATLTIEVTVLLLLALGQLQLAACAPSEPAAAAAAPRVVSLHQVTTEVVVALGATATLVGVGEPVDASAELARALAGVPRVAGLESVLAVRPDVVLGLGTVAEQDPELVAALRARGIEVLLADPATLADVFELVRAVASRVGAAPAGAALVARLEARAAEPSAAAGTPGGVPATPGTPTLVPATPGTPLRVFVYDCCDPPFTAGGKTVLTDLIRRAGGVNVFADLDGDWTNVSWEAAVARAPQLVIVHAYDFDGQGDVLAKRAAIARLPSLRGLPVVVVPLGEALGGLRSLDGLARLRSAFAEARR